MLEYDDRVPGAIDLDEPLTPGAVSRLIEQGAGALSIGPNVPAAGLARLAEIPTLRHLDVSAARALTDDALAAISTLNGVVSLNLHNSAFGSPHYTARGVAHLGRMASLEALNFHGALATDEVLAGIAAIPRLRWLHCQDPVSGDAGFAALAECRTLEHLGARICRRMTDRGFAALARLPGLQHLALGGPRLADAAWASLADAPALLNLTPVMCGDAAFEHIATIPRLERLTNMNNRSTGDAATRRLGAHPTLVYYGAFGTQIGDESLRLLAGLPRLEVVDLTNCDFVTDEGVRGLARLPRLRRVSVGSCVRATGAWRASMPAGIEARHDGSSLAYVNGYRAETLIDYPDVPVPPDAAIPLGTPPDDAGILSRMVCYGGRAVFTEEGLRLAAPERDDPRRAGLLTREAFAVPLRVELVVMPVSELRLAFAAHNRFIALDDRGRVVDRTPWFLQSPSQQGEAAGGDLPSVDAGWTRVALALEEAERRLYVNGELRHVWRDDFAGVRGRIAIGVQRSALTVRALGVEALAPGAGIGDYGVSSA